MNVNQNMVLIIAVGDRETINKNQVPINKRTDRPKIPKGTNLDMKYKSTGTSNRTNCFFSNRFEGKIEVLITSCCISHVCIAPYTENINYSHILTLNINGDVS